MAKKEKKSRKRIYRWKHVAPSAPWSPVSVARPRAWIYNFSKIGFLSGVHEVRGSTHKDWMRKRRGKRERKKKKNCWSSCPIFDDLFYSLLVCVCSTFIHRSDQRQAPTIQCQEWQTYAPFEYARIVSSPIEISSVYWKAIILGIDKSANADWILHVSIFSVLCASSRLYLSSSCVLSWRLCSICSAFNMLVAGVCENIRMWPLKRAPTATTASGKRTLRMRHNTNGRNNICARNFLFWMRNTTVHHRRRRRQ